MHAPAPKDLSPREAAVQTGLSRTLIYREVDRGNLRAYKVGGRLRIPADALEDWKRRHAVVARQPPPYEPARPRRPEPASAFARDLRALRAGRAA